MHIALRDVTEDDLPILFEHQREPDAVRMVAWPSRDHDAFMTHWRTNVLPGPSTKAKAIVVDGEVAGHIDSWDDDGRRLIGYWIGQAHWGKGVATAALRALLADHEHTRPLYAYVATRNVGSLRVLDKCGFAQVGEPETGPGPGPGDDGVEEALMQLR